MVGKRTTKEKSRVEIDDNELISAYELATSLKVGIYFSLN